MSDDSSLENERALKQTKPVCVTWTNRKLSTLPTLKLTPPIAEIDVSDNPRIKDFTGLKFLPSLSVLRANHTGISSFRGALQLPLLQELSLEGTPIATYKYMRLMALMCFGTNIRVINGVFTTDEAAATAAEQRHHFIDVLLDGYLILNLPKKEVWLPGEKNSLILDMDPEEAREVRAQIAEKRQQTNEILTEMRELLRAREHTKL